MDYGVGARVMSFESIAAYSWNVGKVLFVSSSESVTTSYVCGGELSSSSGLLVMQLANIKESNFLL
jgi:hypothetical protein